MVPVATHGLPRRHVTAGHRGWLPALEALRHVQRAERALQRTLCMQNSLSDQHNANHLQITAPRAAFGVRPFPAQNKNVVTGQCAALLRCCAGASRAPTLIALHFSDWRGRVKGERETFCPRGQTRRAGGQTHGWVGGRAKMTPRGAGKWIRSMRVDGDCVCRLEG